MFNVRCSRFDLRLAPLAGVLAIIVASPLLPLRAEEPVALWDTLRHEKGAYPADALVQKSRWQRVEDPTRSVTGDLCLENSKLILALRARAGTAECYAKLGTFLVKVADLSPAAELGKAPRLEGIKLLEAKPESARVEAKFAGATVSFMLSQGQPFVEVLAGEGAARIVIGARSKYALLPDLFSGDLLVNARDTQASQLRFPNENMLALLGEGGDALVTCVWQAQEQGVSLKLDGPAGQHSFASAEIGFGKEPGSRVWVAALAAPAVWAEHPISGLNPVKDVAMDWKVPFRALWRADFPRTDGLIDSWKCPVRKGENEYEGFDFAPKKARSIWHSARGTFAYPTCIEGESCLLRKSRFEPRPELQYDDTRTVVVYPFQAIPGSLPGTFGVFDVLREALKGTSLASLPQELQIEPHPLAKWPATCAVTAEYEKVFDAGGEKAQKQFLLERLDAMNNFIHSIRSRMNEYLDWAKQTREWLAKSKAAQPQLATLVDEADGYVALFSKTYEQRKLDERTPAAARVLIDKVIALIDSSEPAEVKNEQIKQLGRDTRTIGGNQDSSIGEFRMFTKQLRQRAGYRMMEAQNDLAFDFERAVRQRTVDVLRLAFGHESANLD